jgi:hypothetical protein
MSCRLLEKYREAEREIFDEAQGNKMALEYYLLTSETDDCDKIMKTYGIEIVKRVEGSPAEAIGFENVHPDRERIRKIIGILAENTVTPVSLPDILEDFL